MSQFVRAQLLLAVISGIVYTSDFRCSRVPYAFVLGAVGGLLEFIPWPVLPRRRSASSAFASASVTHTSCGWCIFLAAWRVVQDYVISPKLLGSKVELHPLLTIFGILAGGEIAGVIGIYLSVPVIATMKIIVHAMAGAYSAAAALADGAEPVVIAARIAKGGRSRPLSGPKAPLFASNNRRYRPELLRFLFRRLRDGDRLAHVADLEAREALHRDILPSLPMVVAINWPTLMVCSLMKGCSSRHTSS